MELEYVVGFDLILIQKSKSNGVGSNSIQVFKLVCNPQ